MGIVKKNWKPMLLIVVAIVFIGYGVYRGEVDIVFTKAIRLCLECVGIG